MGQEFVDRLNPSSAAAQSSASAQDRISHNVGIVFGSGSRRGRWTRAPACYPASGGSGGRGDNTAANVGGAAGGVGELRGQAQAKSRGASKGAVRRLTLPAISFNSPGVFGGTV